MASFITAGNATNGLQVSSDNTGILELRTGTGSGTTAVTFDTGQRATFPSTISVGNTTPSTSGAGITFPATQSASSNANTLDDYEEGTWTCTFVPVSGFTPTSNTATGYYTKIGRQVTVMAIATMNVPASLGTYVNNSINFQLSIQGLPFSIINDIQARSAPAVGVTQLLGTTSGVISGHGAQNETTIAIFQSKFDGTTRTSPNLTVNSTANMHFCFTYFTS